MAATDKSTQDHSRNSIKRPPPTMNDSNKSTTKRRRIHHLPPPKLCKKRKTPVLPRPRRPLVASAPQTLSAPFNTSSNNSSIPPLTRLTNTVNLLTALHHRNKNQHRSQPFFKHLTLLRSNVTRLIHLISDEQSVSSTATPTASSARIIFERQASLRGRREVLEAWIRETVVPACYVAFTAVVADVQFANLGVVLVGALSDVFGVAGGMKRVDRPVVVERRGRKKTEGKGSPATVEGLSTTITGADRGEKVVRIYGESDVDVGDVVEREPYEPVKPAEDGRRDRIGDLVAEVPRHNDRKHLDDDVANQTQLSDPAGALKDNNSHPASPSTSISTSRTQVLTQRRHQPPASPTRTVPTTSPLVVAATRKPLRTKDAAAPPSQPQSKPQPTTKTKTKTKDNKTTAKKKKRDAIDDLFSGFD